MFKTCPTTRRKWRQLHQTLQSTRSAVLIQILTALVCPVSSKSCSSVLKFITFTTKSCPQEAITSWARGWNYNMVETKEMNMTGCPTNLLEILLNINHNKQYKINRAVSHDWTRNTSVYERGITLTNVTDIIPKT